MVKKAEKSVRDIEKLSFKATQWIGTPYSVIIHTFVFAGMFALYFLGVNTDKILLILTTLVSLEAIYLAIFIQMTVNRNTASLEAVEDEIEDIQEDFEDLEEDLDQIQADQDEDEKRDLQDQKDLDKIEKHLQSILGEIDALKKSRMV